MKRVRGECPTVKRERENNCPTVKRETGGNGPIIPLQRVVLHKDEQESPNSETGIPHTHGEGRPLCAACLPLSKGRDTSLRSMPPSPTLRYTTEVHTLRYTY